MMVTPPQAAQALRATCTVDVGLLCLTNCLLFAVSDQVLVVLQLMSLG